MNSRMPCHLIIAVLSLVIVWAILAVQMPQSAQAGGVVTNCTEQGFDAALAGGGSITFNCNNNHSPVTIYFNYARTINANTTIDGANGGNTISIVPVDGTRAFSVALGVGLTLKNLIIMNGFDTDGGCIYTNGALTLNNVILQNCTAGSGKSGGAIYVTGTGSATINNSQVVSNTAYVSGGGIYNLGALTVNGSYFAHNRLPDLSNQSLSSQDGGGIWTQGTATVDSTTFFSNTALNGFGGAIYNQGTLNVTNSTLSTNRVQKGGGGIQNYLGTTTVQNTNVISNSVAVYDSDHGGGGLMNSQGTLNVTNSTLSGNKGNFAGGGIRNDGTATLTNVNLTGNNAEYAGGIRNGKNSFLTWNWGIVSNNTAYLTGGIYNYNNGQMTLTNLTVTGNKGQSNGGGINSEGSAVLTGMTITANESTGGYGGGIAGTVTLVDSTVSGNKAYNGGGIWGGGYIYNSTISGNSARNDGGGIYSAGTTNIINSTISDNHADDFGGGIFVYSGAASLFNVTVSDNVANDDGDNSGFAGGVSNGATFNFINSIIGPNYSVNGNIIDWDDCYGTLNSQGYNILSNSSCTFSGTAPAIVDPKLGGLQNNGGTTKTHALLLGSPAINAGDPNGCRDNNGNPISVDQRGQPRTVSGRCDIGAYEYNPNPPTNTFTPSPTFTRTRTRTPTPTVTRTSTPTRTLTRTLTPQTPPTATPCASAPPEFNLLKPLNDALVTKARVNLDWADAVCATKYKVTVKSGSKTGPKVASAKVTTSKFKTAALPPGDYYWRAKACNAFGCKKSTWFHFTRE